ncbi:MULTISPECIES: hypothetical protein [unclassified Microcoleus]
MIADRFCIYSSSVPEERVQYAIWASRTLNKKNAFCKTALLPILWAIA